MRKIHLLIGLFTLCAVSVDAAKKSATHSNIYHDTWIDFNKNGVMDVYEDPNADIEARVDNLLSQMTVEEKTCQLATLYGYGRVLKDSLPTPSWKTAIWKDGIANIDEQLNGYGKGTPKAHNLIYPFSNHVKALNQTQRWFIENTRLGIPAEFSNEGIHGLNHTKATPLPAPVGIGSTWNRELVYWAGRIVGQEAKTLGYHSVYAPILDLPRDPRWGRTVECYSEDPFLTAELGIQMCKGIQEQGVASCLKHFAAYSVPIGGRDGGCRTDPHINPRTLHEIFLYPFQRTIQEAHPWEIMSSYNDWNGLPVTGSSYFLQDLLRDTYGFKGYVVSDSKAVIFLHSKHAVADSPEEAVRQACNAGLNVRTDFTPSEDYILPLRHLIATGKLSMDVVNDRVRDVLRVKFAVGLFDKPYCEEAVADKTVGSEHQQDFTFQMESQAMVLLKNNQLLPLDTTKMHRVLVTGPLADEDNFMNSRYGPNELVTTTMLQGMKQFSHMQVSYAKGCDVVNKNWPNSELVAEPLTDAEKKMMDEAVEAAKNVDVIVACLGEDYDRVGESRSRTSMDLPGHQQILLERLYATGKPIVLVLVNGRPLTINWANAKLPAILESWFPTSRGGEIVAKMLVGDIAPSGKLSVTFPKSMGQIEYAFPYKKGARGNQPKKGPNGSGCTRVLGSLYPFGFGLTYTTFDYSNMSATLQGDSLIRVNATIRNTGKRAGTEIVQLYVKDVVSSVVTYESILRGFDRVELAPGEAKQIQFSVPISELRIMDAKDQWVTEAGDFEIMLGASSEDIRCKSTINLPHDVR